MNYRIALLILTILFMLALLPVHAEDKGSPYSGSVSVTPGDVDSGAKIHLVAAVFADVPNTNFVSPITVEWVYDPMIFQPETPRFSESLVISLTKPITTEATFTARAGYSGNYVRRIRAWVHGPGISRYLDSEPIIVHQSQTKLYFPIIRRL